MHVMLNRIFIIVSLLVLTGLTSGCVGLSLEPAKALVGRWQTQMGGFPMQVEYTANAVSVDNQAPVVYELVGDRLSFSQGSTQVRILSFPTKSQMIQLDPMTGTEHRFDRLP
jgi:hypothetical protein